MINVGSFSPVLHKNICCGYSLETPHRSAANKYPQCMFLWRNKKKYQTLFLNKSYVHIHGKYAKFLFIAVTAVLKSKSEKCLWDIYLQQNASLQAHECLCCLLTELLGTTESAIAPDSGGRGWGGAIHIIFFL